MAWVPLESNPEVMTKFLHKLGVPKPWGIVDVCGLEPDLLAMIPKPVLAVILLYPVSAKVATEEVPKEPEDTSSSGPSDVYHIKQYISNACGTIALIHSVANNLESINLQEGVLKKFLDETKDLTVHQRGEHLMTAISITNTHHESAQEGQTEAPGEDIPVYYHFVALVQKNGVLYELDGRKPGPVEHGSTSPETFLEDAARVCKEYIGRNPEDLYFTAIALAACE